MSSPASLARFRVAVALFCAAGMPALGCGQGLFGGLHVDASPPSDTRAPSDAGLPSDADAPSDTTPDAGAPSDASPESRPDSAADAGSDAGADAASDALSDSGGGETSNDEISKTVDKNGDDMYLAEAHLIIGPGTFVNPTQVTLRRIPSIPYAGAWGPVFQISVPSRGLFRQVARLVLEVQDIGANQPNLALGTLDPSRAFADQQWIPAADSSLNAEQTEVSGSVTGFGNANVLQYAAVVLCKETPTCPSGQACNAGACQQCPTSSPCAP